jgi:hypothetical protein
MKNYLLEIAYINYMFFIFKTKWSIHHPLEFNNVSSFFKHPINTGLFENKICDFGRYMAIIFSILILLREKYPNKGLNKTVVNLTIIFSILMNLNAFIYLIPVFLYEYQYILI